MTGQLISCGSNEHQTSLTRVLGKDLYSTRMTTQGLGTTSGSFSVFERGLLKVWMRDIRKRGEKNGRERLTNTTWAARIKSDSNTNFNPRVKLLSNRTGQWYGSGRGCHLHNRREREQWLPIINTMSLNSEAKFTIKK